MSITVHKQAVHVWDTNHDGIVQFKELSKDLQARVQKMRVAFPKEFEGVDTVEGDALRFLEAKADTLAPKILPAAEKNDAGRHIKSAGFINIGASALGVTGAVVFGILAALNPLTGAFAVLALVGLGLFLVCGAIGSGLLVKGFNDDDTEATDAYGKVAKAVDDKLAELEAARKAEPSADELARLQREKEEKARIDAQMLQRGHVIELETAHGEISVGTQKVSVDLKLNVDWNRMEVRWDPTAKKHVIQRLLDANVPHATIDAIMARVVGDSLLLSGDGRDPAKLTEADKQELVTQALKAPSKDMQILFVIAAHGKALSNQQVLDLTAFLALASNTDPKKEKAAKKADAVLSKLPN